MTNDEYRDIRRRYRESAELDPRLARELRRIASRLVRYGGLPSAYAPYRIWNREAEEELFQGWYAGRLVNAGQLQALLDRAATIESFRRLGERSLRQHVLNQRERSQVQNLYSRTAELLRDDDDFASFVESARPQDVWWGLATWRDPPQFSRSDNDLFAAAWSLGEFEIIRYRADAKKLAPVLAAVELKRFVVGLLLRKAVTCPAHLEVCSPAHFETAASISVRSGSIRSTPTRHRNYAASRGCPTRSSSSRPAWRSLPS